MEDKYEEYNKLIAEFMGWNIKSPTTIPTNLHLSNLELDNGEVMELQFQEPWAWLMTVVEDIESFKDDNNCCKYNVNIQQCWVEIIDNENSDEIVAVDGYDKKAATYNAVVEFIKWYNKNQKA